MAIRLLQFMEFCCQGTWLTGKNLRGADALDGLKLPDKFRLAQILV